MLTLAVGTVISYNSSAPMMELTVSGKRTNAGGKACIPLRTLTMVLLWSMDWVRPAGAKLLDTIEPSLKARIALQFWEVFARA